MLPLPLSLSPLLFVVEELVAIASILLAALIIKKHIISVVVAVVYIFLVFKICEITAFIRTDRQADKRTDGN